MKNLFNQVVCISWSSALCFIPGPGSDLRSFACPAALAPNLDSPALARCLYLPALVPNFYLQALASNLFLLALAPSLCLPALAPNLHLPSLVYNLINSPGPEFWIYRPCPLNLCLYLRPWHRICITGPRPEFAFTLLLVVVAEVVVIVVVVISLE